MSVWIRALCTKAVADVTPAELRAGIAERLPLLGPQYGEDDTEGAVAALRVEGEAPMRAWALFHRVGEHSIRLERWSDRGRVREELDMLRGTLEDCDEDGVDEVRELLDHVVETVALELSMGDCEGMGWPVAIAAAAYLAARGEGLVQADGEGWMEPHGRELEHVLDGD